MAIYEQPDAYTELHIPELLCSSPTLDRHCALLS